MSTGASKYEEIRMSLLLANGIVGKQATVLAGLFADLDARLQKIEERGERPEACPKCGSAYLDSRGNCGECLERMADANVVDEPEPCPFPGLSWGDVREVVAQCNRGKWRFLPSRSDLRVRKSGRAQ